MASLRTSSAVRLLRGASHNQSILPALRRYESSIPMKQKEETPYTTPHRKTEEYDVQADKATSYVDTYAHAPIFIARIVANGSLEPLVPFRNE